jgi:hypothetical protein
MSMLVPVGVHFSVGWSLFLVLATAHLVLAGVHMISDWNSFFVLAGVHFFLKSISVLAEIFVRSGNCPVQFWLQLGLM